jgi:outer membrane protein OmpA-like peptidoglycan-associated protein
MRSHDLTPLQLTMVAVCSLLLAACSSTPERNATLDQARSSYEAIRDTPNANTLAALELKDAENALASADLALSEGEDAEVIEHRAYLAKQRAELAKETYNLKMAEAELKKTEAQRTQTQLDVRTAQLAALQAKQTDRGTVVTLGDVLFDTGKSDLKTGGLRNMQKLAEFLRSNPQRKVMVEGFTDSVGSDSFNMELSDRRANSVRMALIDLGIDSNRIDARGYGEGYPVAGNDTPSGRQMNRRVEVIISDESGTIRAR